MTTNEIAACLGTAFSIGVSLFLLWQYAKVSLKHHEADKYNDKLKLRIQRIQRQAGFLASVIKSGEQWSSECQVALDEIFSIHE